MTSILTQKSGSAALLNLGYSYYANSQISRSEQPGQSENGKYTYDELRRLLTASAPGHEHPAQVQLRLRPFGNRWAQTLVAGSGFAGLTRSTTQQPRTSPILPSTTPATLTANGPGRASPSPRKLHHCRQRF